MKRNAITIVIGLLVLELLDGQKWNYRSDESAFDGKYRICYVMGSGNEFPYNNPLFVVNLLENNRLNVYLQDVGYAGCDNKMAYIKFDNDSKVYTFKVLTNSDRDTWFLQENIRNSQPSLYMIELLEKLKAHNKVYVRLSSDCGQNDFMFPLLGSSVAINYVASDYIKKQKQILLSKQNEEEKKKRLIELISSGDTFKTKAYYNASLYYEPNTSSICWDLNLTTDEEIIFSHYSNDKDFCILEKATTIDLPKDSIFYISKSCVNLDFIERIE